MKFIYKFEDHILAWSGGNTIWMFRKLKPTYDSYQMATYDRKSNIWEKNKYEMEEYEEERLNHIYEKLVREKGDKEQFARYLFFIFIGQANIAEFYNFVYTREYTYCEEWRAFKNMEKAEEYVKKHSKASIEDPEKWGDYIKIKFNQKPWKDGSLYASLMYED